MPSFSTRNRQTLAFVALVLLLALAAAIQGQDQKQQSNPPTDVIRINTELVQTDLMVFDKQGRFVDGLTPEQFELSLDGKPQTISFFERVAAGTAAEAEQLSAAARNASANRDSSSKSGTRNAATSSSASGDRRRVIFFFLDDLHLSSDSIVRARKALQNFVENQMSRSDQVAIVSTSGQIGFLQQLTDNRAVLSAAISRLNYKRDQVPYAGRTVITEYQASQVEDHNNKDLFNYLVTSTLNEYQIGTMKAGNLSGIQDSAVNIVKGRVQQINSESKAVALNTLSVLESLMVSSARLPGRKLVFFMSDGFMTDARNSRALGLLQRISTLAARVGAIVYTMDPRGMVPDASVDAGRNDFPDGLASGSPARQPSLETSAMREPLFILAEQTGGRAIMNSNSIEAGIQQAIRETSDYYLLAWRPESEAERNGRTKIKVSVKGRPDLTVRLRNGFYTPPSVSNDKAEAAAQTREPEVELLAALGSLYPNKQLPTSISTGYLNTTDSGVGLRISMQIERDAFNFEQGEQKALVDVIGAAIDDRGVISTFKQLLTVTNDPSSQSRALPIIWHQQLKLPPGLYQVRVATRDRQTGRTGSAMQWIEIPDLAQGRLNLSSLFLGERRREEIADASSTNTPQAIMVDVDHHFARTSVLRFQTYVYNAARGAGAPDVWIQAQVLRDDRPLISLSASKVPTAGSIDQERLPYWAEVSLEQLPAGRYVLVVTATDRTAKTSATQQMNFIVE